MVKNISFCILVGAENFQPNVVTQYIASQNHNSNFKQK